MLPEGRCCRSGTTVGHLKGVSGTIICASNHREKWYMPVKVGQARCLIGHSTGVVASEPRGSDVPSDDAGVQVETYSCLPCSHRTERRSPLMATATNTPSDSAMTSKAPAHRPPPAS